MNAGEKFALAGFLDLTACYLKDGYARDEYFEADEYFETTLETTDTTDTTVTEDISSLPLVYQIDEDEDAVTRVSADIAECEACGLAATRTLVVPGEGVENPLIMVVGEGPGADEDKTGRPFVGKTGQLLDKMLESIGLSRNTNCFIANTVKCRPPGNREPEHGEMAACFPFLERQIKLLCPRVILCAGRIAAQNLLKTDKGINALRGEFTELRIGDITIPVLCTFHPSALLRDESLKRPAWEDLKLLKSHLELPE